MPYQEKKIIISMISSLLVLAAYWFYIYQNYPAEITTTPTNFRFWGKTILILIPVSIVSRIVIMILFTIANRIATREEEPSFSDERDKLIELKAMRNSHWIFILGFFVAMGSLALGIAPYWMFIIIILSGFISEMADGFSQLYYYRKGI